MTILKNLNSNVEPENVLPVPPPSYESIPPVQVQNKFLTMLKKNLILIGVGFSLLIVGIVALVVVLTINGNSEEVTTTTIDIKTTTSSIDDTTTSEMTTTDNLNSQSSTYIEDTTTAFSTVFTTTSSSTSTTSTEGSSTTSNDLSSSSYFSTTEIFDLTSTTNNLTSTTEVEITVPATSSTTVPNSSSTTVLTTTSSTTEVPSRNIIEERINQGQCITKNDVVISDRNCFHMQIENNGNLVIYRTSDKRVVWTTDTNGTDSTRACMQNDGNFVLYNNRNDSRWDPGNVFYWLNVVNIWNRPDHALLHTDGQLLLKKGANVKWESGNPTMC